MRLERGGAFGPIPRKYDQTKRKNWQFAPNTADYFRYRELDYRRPPKDTLGEMTVPNSVGVEVSQFTSKVYSGQYSTDGAFFYTACQDFRCVLARSDLATPTSVDASASRECCSRGRTDIASPHSVYIYDTSSPPRVGDKSVTDSAAPRSRTPFMHDWQHRSSLKVKKIVQAQAQNCRWTLTDAELSDDNEWLIYSSISPRAHMVKTGQGNSWETEDHDQETLNFAAGSGSYGGFGVRPRASATRSPAHF